MLLAAESAHPDNTELGALAAMLHFDDRSAIDNARCAIQTGATAADVVCVCILLKRIPEGISAPNFDAQSGGVTRFWMSAHNNACSYENSGSKKGQIT